MEYCSTKWQYCPHLIQTKIKASELFRQTRDVEYVMRRYHVGRAVVYRWNKQYNGTKDSLRNKSHKSRARREDLPIHNDRQGLTGILFPLQIAFP